MALNPLNERPKSGERGVCVIAIAPVVAEHCISGGEIRSSCIRF